MKALTIGELARRGRVNLETIRYYERQGLLAPPPRTASGYRLFPADAARRVRFIKRAQELGFSLREIRELLALQLDEDATCADVLARAEAKIGDIERRIRALQAMKQALERLAAACSGRGPVEDCPLLESLDPEEGGCG